VRGLIAREGHLFAGDYDMDDEIDDADYLRTIDRRRQRAFRCRHAPGDPDCDCHGDDDDGDDEVIDGE
jgi:hypothetical protein